MKIKRQELLEHLNKVMSGVETGNSILEGADTFVFTEDGIYSYNDCISVSIPETTGIVGAVKSKEFFNLLQKLKQDEITLIQKKDVLSIKCGNTRAKIKLVETAILDYLSNLDISSLKWKKIDSEFMTALRLCKLNTSNSPFRGIYVNDDIMVATDEIRVAHYNFKKGYPQFWIDDPSASELMKVGVSFTHIAISDGWVHFKSKDGTTFSCKTNDAKMYPESALLDLVKNTQKKKKDISSSLPDDFKQAIERVSVLSEYLQGFQVVNLTFSPECLTLACERSTGAVYEDLPWEKELKIKEELTTSGDASFLLEACSKSMQFYITTVEESVYIIFTSDQFSLILNTIK